MTREDIIRMAREVSNTPIDHHATPDLFGVSQIERFAALVAAAERNSWPAEMEAMERQVNILTDALAQAKAEEREACAKLVESRKTGANELMDAVRDMEAAAIRARGNDAA